MSGACPVCGGALEAAHGPDAILHLCHGCGGIWLDNAASQRVADAALSREALSHAYGAGARAGSGEGYREASRPAAATGDKRCPVCGETMREVYLPSSTTHVDICPPHGTWFDCDELVAVHQGFENERFSAAARRRQLSAIIGKFRPGK